MSQLRRFRHPNPQKLAAGLVAVLAIALTIVAGTAAAKTGKRVVAEAQNPTLGQTVLTTTKGRTLYSLSVEKNGKFICTGSCLSSWHPLLVPAGKRPTGPVKLGTIARPNGKGQQVTYRGRPLYAFDGDSKPGEANGEGIKDVGTWHAATPPKAQSTPPASESPPPSEPPPYQPPYGY